MTHSSNQRLHFRVPCSMFPNSLSAGIFLRRAWILEVFHAAQFCGIFPYRRHELRQVLYPVLLHTTSQATMFVFVVCIRVS